MRLIECDEYLYEVMRFGVSVYREARDGDMPMLYAKGKHWQCIMTWAR